MTSYISVSSTTNDQTLFVFVYSYPIDEFIYFITISCPAYICDANDPVLLSVFSGVTYVRELFLIHTGCSKLFLYGTVLP